MHLELRPYQQDAVRTVLQELRDKKRVLLVSPTGSGKNAIACGIIEKTLPERCLFLAHTDELVQQPLDSIYNWLGQIGGLEKAHSRAPLTAKVTVASIQSMSRPKRLERFPKDHFSLIIADEAHLSLSDSWKRVLNHFSGRVVGMTATPYRSDLKPLSEIYESTAFKLTPFEVMDQGWLVRIRIETFYRAVDMSGVHLSKIGGVKDLDAGEIADRLEPHFEAMAEEIAKKGQGRHILVFLPLRETSRKFAEICRLHGVSAVHIDGDDPDRKIKLAMFKAGDTNVLCNSYLLHTGVDMPICDTTLNLRSTVSVGLAQQIIGRSTRTLPGLLTGLEYKSSAERIRAILESPKPFSIAWDPLHVFKGLATPYSMFANSMEEAEEMAEKGREKRNQVDALDFAEEFRRQKEDKLVARLIEVRGRKAVSMDAGEFANRFHLHSLAGYEPVFPREKQPLARYQRMILKQNGIDPGTVSNQGQYDLIVRPIYQRIHKGLASLSMVAKAQDLGVTNADEMTQEQIEYELEHAFD